MILELGRPLAAGKSYRLTTTGLRGLTGASHPTTQVIDVPKAPPPSAKQQDSSGKGATPSAAPTTPAAKKPPMRPPADTSLDRPR